MLCARCASYTWSGSRFRRRVPGGTVHGYVSSNDSGNKMRNGSSYNKKHSANYRDGHDRTALAMSCDSRKLRFYASELTTSSSSSGMKSFQSTRSATITRDGFAFYTSARMTHSSSNGNKMGSSKNVLTPSSSIGIYSSGLSNLLTSFDAEFQRTFSKLSDTPYTTSSSNKNNRYQPYSRQNPEKQSRIISQPHNPSIQIDLTPEEDELFTLLRTVTKECGMKSTLRVAGGWVRDKILASREFCRRSSGGSLMENGGEELMNGNEIEEGEMKRITSKFKGEKGG